MHDHFFCVVDPRRYARKRGRNRLFPAKSGEEMHFDVSLSLSEAGNTDWDAFGTVVVSIYLEHFFSKDRKMVCELRDFFLRDKSLTFRQIQLFPPFEVRWKNLHKKGNFFPFFPWVGFVKWTRCCKLFTNGQNGRKMSEEKISICRPRFKIDTRPLSHFDI